SELGSPMEKIFQDFDETPLAAASIVDLTIAIGNPMASY
ncbi:MAG: hypothetical protein F6K65_21815, partial [Moorea sp. SIO3C2]|nr:hypothetical protein [Moorena sp. SIO3C2]